MTFVKLIPKLMLRLQGVGTYKLNVDGVFSGDKVGIGVVIRDHMNDVSGHDNTNAWYY